MKSPPIGDNHSHYAYTYNGQGNVSLVDNAGTPGVPDVLLASQFDASGNRSSLSATIGGVKDFLSYYSYDTLSWMTMGNANGDILVYIWQRSQPTAVS